MANVLSVANLTRVLLRKFLQFQHTAVLQKPSGSAVVWQYTGPAINCSVLRLQSNKSGGSEQTKPSADKGKSAPPPPSPPTDGSTYQSTEYYGYNEMSFYDLESSMIKYRLTQPDPSKPEQ